MILVNIVTNDVRSTTARNVALISEETGVCFKSLTAMKVRNLILIKPVPVA